MRKRKPLSKEIRNKVWALKGNKCCYCKINLLLLPVRDRTIEHTLQVYVGGTNEIDNLKPCCRSCNSTRHSMEPEEFIEYLSLKQKGFSRYELYKERKKLKAKYDEIYTKTQ